MEEESAEPLLPAPTTGARAAAELLPLPAGTPRVGNTDDGKWTASVAYPIGILSVGPTPA